jgi:hypothetical protein
MRKFLIVLVCGVVAVSSAMAGPAAGVSPEDRRTVAEAGYSIGKVYEYLNDDTRTKNSIDRSLEFERRYHKYPAVTSLQRREKEGHYFYVNWRAPQGKNLVVRFQYRQKKTKDRIYTMEVPYPHAAGLQETIFEVVGDAYDRQGVVNSWRVSVFESGRLVAQRTSFVW